MWGQDRYKQHQKLPVDQNRGGASPPCPGLLHHHLPRGERDLTHCRLPVSTTVPSKQKGQSPTLTNRQPACCISGLGVILSASLPAKGPGWKVNLHWSACCCVHVQSPTPFWGNIAPEKGLEKARSHKPTNLYSFWGDRVVLPFLPTPVLCPTGGQRLSTSGLC